MKNYKPQTNQKRGKPCNIFVWAFTKTRQAAAGDMGRMSKPSKQRMEAFWYYLRLQTVVRQMLSYKVHHWSSRRQSSWDFLVLQIVEKYDIKTSLHTLWKNALKLLWGRLVIEFAVFVGEGSLTYAKTKAIFTINMLYITSSL